MGIELTGENSDVFPLDNTKIREKIEHPWIRSKWAVIVASSLIEAGCIGLGIVAYRGVANGIDIDKSAYPNIGNNPALSVTIEGTGLFIDDFGLWGDVSSPCISDGTYRDGGRREVLHLPVVVWNRDPDLFPDIPTVYTFTCDPS